MATIDYFVHTVDGDDTAAGLTRSGTGTYWAVGFDAGGTATPVVDSDSISFSTSGYTGTLRKVILISGAWSGTAKGIIIFEDATRSGAAPVDGETITFTGSGASATTHVAANNAYGISLDAAAHATFQGWEVDYDGMTDWQSGDTVNVWCQGSTADGTMNMSGWDASADNLTLLQIAADDGSADGVVAYSSGGLNTGSTWSNSHHRFVNAGNLGNIQNPDCPTTLKNLQAHQNGSTGYLWTFTNFGDSLTIDGCRLQHDVDNVCVVLTGNTSHVIQNNIVCMTGVATSTVEAFRLAVASTITTFNNNVIYTTTNAGKGVELASGDTISAFYNNVIYNFDDDIDNSGTITASGTNMGDTAEAEIAVAFDTKWFTTTGSGLVSGDDWTPLFSNSASSAYDTGTAAQVSQNDCRGVSRGAESSGTKAADLGALHADAPIVYVDAPSGNGDADGRSNAHAFAALSTAEAQAQDDLTVGSGKNRVLTVYCAGGQDSTAVDWNGYTLDATNKVTIAADPGQSDGFNDTATFSTSHYYLDVDDRELEIHDSHVDVDGIQFLSNTTATGRHALYLNTGADTHNITRCRFRKTNTQTFHKAIFLDVANTTVVINNCIIEWYTDGTSNSQEAIWSNQGSGHHVTVRNCTIDSAYISVRLNINASTRTVENCIVLNCDTDFLNVSTINYNITTQADQGGTNIKWTAGTDDAKYLADPTASPADYTPVYSDGASAAFGNADGAVCPSANSYSDVAGTSRGTAPTTGSMGADIGAIHLASPIGYVNLDDPGDDDGRSHAHGWASLSDAETAMQGDLVANNRNVTILCGTDGTDYLDNGTGVLIDGWTTGSANTITIQGNSSSSGVQTGTKFNNGTAYTLQLVGTANNQQAIRPVEDYVNIADLQIEIATASAVSGQRGIRFAGGTASDNARNVDRCWIVSTSSGATGGSCSQCNGTNSIINFTSCVFDGRNTNVDSAFDNGQSGVVATFYNCVMAHCDSANGTLNRDNGTFNVYRSAFVGNVDDLNGIISTNTECAFDQHTGDGVEMVETANTDMVDAANYDYRPYSSGVLDGGATANPGGNDLIGTAWSVNNIGAFNDVVAAGGGLGIPIAMYHYLNNVGSRL